jgi:hypothetical protein
MSSGKKSSGQMSLQENVTPGIYTARQMLPGKTPHSKNLIQILLKCDIDQKVVYRKLF